MYSYEEIKEQLVKSLPYANLNDSVKHLSKILGIGPSTVYNKLNGRSRFSVEEFFTISKYLKISLDSVIFRDVKDEAPFPFLADGLRYSPRSYSDYLNNIIRHFGEYQKLPNISATFLANEIPIFHFLPFPNLCYLKMYVWNLTTWHISKTNNAYNPDVLLKSKETLGSINTLFSLFNSFDTVEIWNPFILEATLSQIHNLLDSNVIDKQKFLKPLITDLRMMVRYLEDLTDTGLKLENGYKKNTDIKVYLNELVISSEIIMISSEDKKFMYKSYDTPNYIKSNNFEMCEYMDQWLKNIIFNSTNITQSGDKTKKWLFNRLTDGINKLEARLN